MVISNAGKCSQLEMQRHETQMSCHQKGQAKQLTQIRLTAGPKRFAGQPKKKCCVNAVQVQRMCILKIRLPCRNYKV